MTNKQYYYPNNMGRIILLALEDIIGQKFINTLLNGENLSHVLDCIPPTNFDRQFSFEYLSQMMACIESAYGPRAGRGLALRSGQACFKYGLREFGPMIGVSDMAFRLLPLSTKLTKGANLFAGAFNQYSDQEVRVEEDGEHIYWHIDRCPICWQRQSDQPTCHLAVGILQESLYWVSGGKNFLIEETDCIAKGDSSCTIEINKQPLS
ncbi:MAG: 4-vinyl reductase [Anaerolineales bacterium]|nr:4-vinyl reductase [Anaerolineales bacterium]